MKKILNYLNSKKIVPDKKGHFYVIWVSKFIKFLDDKPVDKIDNDDIKRFINKLSKICQQWHKIVQRKGAILCPSYPELSNLSKSGCIESVTLKVGRKVD